MSAAFAAVDWGSSHVRLWLMDETGEVLAERRSADGMLKAQGKFGEILEDHLSAFGVPEKLPVFACGMVGARQGWVEAPYVAVPAALETIFAQAVRVSHEKRPVLILPGLSQGSPADVMRGEETQLAGLVETLRPGAALACLPGTHSKWAELDGDRVAGFATYLTGELFAVLREHSILRHSLADAEPASGPSAVFRTACGEILEDGDLPGRLFGVRAGGLLSGTSANDSAARLSGLLIGAEIFAARQRFAGSSMPVLLVASGTMRALYEAALELAGLPFTHADADLSVRAGLYAAARHYRELWI
ncbi:MAG: 2-dehydro-3-deoxygalactonokinase [Methylobacterium mesophilicum]|nr:2-dehydro-3-deoxygalactonokinase [Methylobacterium mesophilicum]